MWSWFSSADEEQKEPVVKAEQSNYDYHWSEIEKRNAGAQKLRTQTWGDAIARRPEMSHEPHSKALGKEAAGFYRPDALLLEHRQQAYSFGAYQMIDADRVDGAK